MKVDLVTMAARQAVYLDNTLALLGPPIDFWEFLQKVNHEKIEVSEKHEQVTSIAPFPERLEDVVTTESHRLPLGQFWEKELEIKEEERIAKLKATPLEDIAEEIADDSSGCFYVNFDSEAYQLLDQNKQSQVQEKVWEFLDSCACCGWYDRLDSMEYYEDLGSYCWRCASELEDEDEDDN